MERFRFGLITLITLSPMALKGQDQAAVERLLHRYSAEQVEEMRSNAHFRYASMLLYYASSFQVLENGHYRQATDTEVAGIDIGQYDGVRSEQESVIVHDTGSGLQLRLLSRNEFEQVVLAGLDEADRTDYLAYKAAALETPARTEPQSPAWQR